MGRIFQPSRMFPFITGTVNPLCGKCDFECAYCWARKIVKNYKISKYSGPVSLDNNVMANPKLKGSFIFFVDMLDLFSYSVPEKIIRETLRIPQEFQDKKFLLLTKNPTRYLEVIDDIPRNCYLGATIESDCHYPTISKAPEQKKRLESMKQLRDVTDLPLFICAEPILNFNSYFIESIIDIEPWAVAVGYDNYNHKLPEPPIKKTEELINALEHVEIKVFKKTIRKAWYEK